MTSDDVLAIYTRTGSAAYFGEAVTQTEHAQQAAHFARLCGASDALVLAALLHDIGHLLDPVPAEITDWKTDARHENSGSRWLASRFGAEVSEPVRLHVPAKRYLCAIETTYLRQLSSASIHTLQLQGGPMSAAEIAAFEAERFHRDAVTLRRCDDQGKVAGLRTPDFGHYRELIERLAVKSPGMVDAIQCIK